MRIVGRLLTLAVIVLTVSPIISAVAKNESIVLVGTYTDASSKGIYASRLESQTGSLAPLRLVAEINNPSFLAVHPYRKYVYAVGEDNAGTVTAFSVASKGGLQRLNTVSSKGADPCHLAFDRTGQWLFVAKYSSGSVAVLPVRSDGTLGEAVGFSQHEGASVHPQRQSGPHAHSVNISSDNRFLMVNDLGLDKTLVYRFDSKSGDLTLEPASLDAVPGSGPRHMTFSPDGRFIWVLHELSSTVSAASFEGSSGIPRELQTLSALPAGFTGSNSGAEIAVHPNGRFLYSSNRGHDSIAVFSIDPETGRLRPESWTATGGRTPRNFAIDPTGNFLLVANQDSENIVTFSIDRATGALNRQGTAVDAPKPVSIVFVPEQ